MPRIAERSAAGQQLAAAFHRVGDMGAGLGDGGFVDQWALVGRAGQTRANYQLLRAFRQRRGKGIIDPRLHQNAVGANAGLPRIAEFGGHSPLDRRAQIGIVEHNKRCVAAQLQRHPLDRIHTARRQQFADAR